MRALHRSSAHVQGRTDNFIYGQCLDSHGGADDVHHRIDGPYFVEVDLVDVSVVNLGFRGAECLKNRKRGILRPFTYCGDANYLANLFEPAAMFALVLVLRGRPLTASLAVVV